MLYECSVSARGGQAAWDGENFVGGVFFYPCWPATALLLTYAELMHDENFLNDIQKLYDKENANAG